MIEHIENILKDGEGYRTEFKERPDKDIAVEACAFANASGGTILIGVDDHGNIVGTDTGNAARSKIQDTIDQIEPHPETVIEVQGDVIVVVVKEGKEKPYSCAKGFYLRSGPNSKKMNRDDIIEFMQDEGIIKFDSKIRKEHLVKDNFNRSAYLKYLKKADIDEDLPIDHVLINLGCARYRDDGELAYTNAGALFFRDNTNDSFFMQARVVCALFKGIDKRTVMDAKGFESSMIDNIDDAMIFLRRNLRVRHEIKGVQRYDVLELPEEALREAVTNAVCHRNYFETGINVMVEIFDDRVIIHNPGGLPKGLDMDNLGTKSIPRNPVIAEMLHRAGYIEKMGTGIKKIRDGMAAANLHEPEFESDFFFTVVFEREPLHTPCITDAAVSIDLTINEKKICKLMEEDGYVTSTIMAERLEISKSTVKRITKTLTEKGAITRIGDNKNGYWKIMISNFK